MQKRPRYPRGEINLPQFDFRSIKPWMIYAVIAGVVVIWLMSGIYKVNPEEEGVVRRFGKYVGSTDSGLHYHWPWPFEKVDTPEVLEPKRIEIGFRTVSPATSTSSATYRQIEDESLMLTGDENIVDLDVVVQYRIKDAYQYLFKVRNPESTVQKASEAAIRFVIGKNTIDDAMTENKMAIQDSTRAKLQEILDSYEAGIYVINVNLQDVGPPEQVADAFNDVTSAKQDKNRLVNVAEGYRNDIIPKARGEAEQRIRQAEGYREERIRRARGDIGRFLSILEEYNKSRDVTKTRLYIETMEAILPGMEKYIIQTDENGGILNLLQLNKGVIK